MFFFCAVFVSSCPAASVEQPLSSEGLLVLVVVVVVGWV